MVCTARGLVLGVFFFILPVCLLAQTTVSWQPLNQILTNLSMTADADLRMVVLHKDQEVYNFKVDFRGAPEVLPIASASKWLAGATILRLVDEGLIDLDDPVSLYLPYFRDEKAGITIRQLLTHSSGLSGDYPCLAHRDMPMDDCVRQIAERPLLLTPGADFSYGDVSLQVVARVAETVTGLRWNEIFRSRIAEPLGMEHTTYDNGTPIANPSVAGGAVSTIDEYLRFLRMIRNHGALGDKRILSRRATALMLADQTAGAVVRSTPYSAYGIWSAGAPRNRYGFTNWLEGMEDGLPNANSSQGGFGVSPYYDRERDLIFLLFIYDQRRVYPAYYYQIQSFLHGVIPTSADPAVSAFTLQSVTTTSGIRTWYEYVPKSCKLEDALCPLLIALHANGTNGTAFGTATRLRQKAEREGLILALPNGGSAEEEEPSPEPATEEQFAWNIGAATDDAHWRDDADFVLSMTAMLEQSHPVDPQRIYIAGHREGADIAQRLMCRTPDRFAALASVHATLPYPSAGLRGDIAPLCQPRTTASAFFYTTTEASIPTVPEDAEEDESASSFEFWKQRNFCSVSNQWAPFAPTDLAYTDATGCWPGTTVRQIHSRNSATTWPTAGWEHVWQFLKGNHRPSVHGHRFVAVSAASYIRRESSPSGLLSLFGPNLTLTTKGTSDQPLPMELDGVRAELKDSHGTVRNLGISLISPLQMNLALPGNIAPGTGVITLYRDGDITHRDWLRIRNHAPALFSAQASGEGAAAGQMLYIHEDGSREHAFLWRNDELSGISPAPVEIARPGTDTYLILYGTGWRNASDSTPVQVFIGNHALETLYAGPQLQYEGLDQINVQIPPLDLPSGEYSLYLRVGKQESNRLRIAISVWQPTSP